MRLLAPALAALLVLGLAGPAVAKPVQPTISVSVSGGVGGVLHVSGTGFTPSTPQSQEVILWIGYPNDYCAPQPTDPLQPWQCHGFYNDPWVQADGTFSVDFTDALLQAGTGVVAATQYDQRSDHWRQVDSEPYTVS